jgi:hypothetical protein
MACAFETDSAVGGSPAGPQRVGYNDELPAPGVVIKQDDVFVEGIAHDRKKFSVCLRVAKAGHVSMLFFASDKRPSDADPMAGLIGGFILKRDEEGAASGTCALAKNPRGIFGYCLRCDFSRMATPCFCLHYLYITCCTFCSDDPQTSSQDWELKTNKKIVLCFEQPEPRAHWLDVPFPARDKICDLIFSYPCNRHSYTHSGFQASLRRMLKSKEAKAMRRSPRHPNREVTFMEQKLLRRRRKVSPLQALKRQAPSKIILQQDQILTSMPQSLHQVQAINRPLPFWNRLMSPSHQAPGRLPGLPMGRRLLQRRRQAPST